MPNDTAQRLTDAALLSVREHGYTGTSIQTLLRGTGVSSSSMYHFFPGGKEELVAAAVRHSGLDAAERIGDVFEHYDLDEGITRIFAAAAGEMEQHAYTLGCPIGVPATEAAADSARRSARSSPPGLTRTRRHSEPAASATNRLTRSAGSSSLRTRVRSPWPERPA